MYGTTSVWRKQYFENVEKRILFRMTVGRLTWKISTWNTNIRIIVFIPDEISSLHDGGKFESKF